MPMTQHTGGIDLAHTPDVATREDEGVVVHVEEATGELAFYQNGTGQSPVTITVAGTYSHRYRRAMEHQRQRVFRGSRRRVDPEAAYQQALDLVAACVISWDGFTNNGQPFACTRENAVALFERAPWILRQVEDAMEDHQGFFKRASPSSPTS